MKILSNLEFVILALVAEKPVHGYQLEQLITERGMRDWADIGFSSIYHVLQKLQKTGILSSQIKTTGDRPSRKVFSITTNGFTLLHDEVLFRLSTPLPYSADFDLALTCLPMLPREEVRSALEIYQMRLSEKIKVVEEKKEHIQHNLSPHVEALFEHSLNAMRAELQWISNYSNQME